MKIHLKVLFKQCQKTSIYLKLLRQLTMMANRNLFKAQLINNIKKKIANANQ